MTENPEYTIMMLKIFGYGGAAWFAAFYFAKWLLKAQRDYDNRPRRPVREGEK